MELRIPAGGMYQEWGCLIDLLEQDKANSWKRWRQTAAGVRFSLLKPLKWASRSWWIGLWQRRTYLYWSTRAFWRAYPGGYILLSSAKKTESVK